MANKDVFDEEDVRRINAEFESLMSNLRRCNKPGDRELIEKAFALANDAHWNMRRKSGEPYIIHPINVAKIANQEIGLGTTSVVSSLLHDIVEDTDYTVADIEKVFGAKISLIINGLTKISGTYKKETSASMQAENFRRMLLTISDDLRVILIKIADRLHNMRTIDAMPEHKRMKIAGETVFMYAPLAHRLGLYTIKSELEDLSFRARQPQVYNEIAAKIKHGEKKSTAAINRFSLPIIEKLTEAGFEFDISGRPKSIFSIWKKMQAKNVPFEEIYDMLAVRIVFKPAPSIPEKTQCWNIYSIITDLYLPKPDRLRDWVSRPKPNGYEALHLTVMGPEGRWIEVQVRSERMDEIAERGYAAHWKYKGDESPESELDKWIKKISHILENQLEDPVEFLDEFKMNTFSTEIMVFTPKGLLISLPKGASALDFAYEIHTEIGNKAIGAKINYKLNPIGTILSSGDQVEIITSDIAKPDSGWLNYAHTSKAKASIMSAIRTQSREIIQKGLKILESQLSKSELTGETVKKLCAVFEMPSRNELLTNIGLENITPDEIRKNLKKRAPFIKWELKLPGSGKNRKSDKSHPAAVDKKESFLLSENPEDASYSYTIAKCCNPIPGDEVTGYHSPGDGSIIIHKSRCPEAIRLMSNEGNRIIAVKWAIHKLNSFKARIQMNGIDRIGVINEITNIISAELHVNISGINLAVNNGIFEGTIDLDTHHTKDLDSLILKISGINGIENVKRVEEYP
ncbi:MAG: RelA/SpoT family protein [Bacteroidales bacterium]|nr:RelA/SpoT family protein [Bacteroidales bacterium]